MRLRLAAPVCVLFALVGCSSNVPVTECGGNAREVDGVCRPLCGGPQDCLGDEHCGDGVCLPGPASPVDASVGMDAVEVHDDATTPVGDDADVFADAEEQKDGGPDTPKDAEPMHEDSGEHPDARPPRDAGPVPIADLVFRNGFNIADPLLVDERFALAVTVENIGDLVSGATSVAAYVNPPGVHEVRAESVRIGTASLNAIVAGNARAVTINALVPTTVPPGARSVIVVVDPDQQVAEADETNNISLVADVDITTITVTPTLDFGMVVAPCGQATRSVQISNRSTVSPVDVTGVELVTMSDVFEPRPPMVPTTLAPNTSLGFAVVFGPDVPGSAQNQLRIHHAQPGSPLMVNLIGTGVSGRVNDPFPGMNQVRAADLVFVVDPSLSNADRGELVTRAGPILADLQARGIAYRVAVMQAGALAGSRGFLGTPAFITPNTPAGATALGDRFDDTSSAVPVANAGFAEIDRALVATTPGLAADAWLEVVVVSDRDDSGSLAASTLATRVRNEKPIEGVSRVSGIVVTPTSMCTGTGGMPRYNDLIGQTNGASSSVCTRDWTAVLTGIGGPAFGIPYVYPLSRAPDVSSIQVTVNGQPVGAQSYTYDAGLNRVLLSVPALPGPGQDVLVSYTPVCP